jgi:hypothetical protein
VSAPRIITPAQAPGLIVNNRESRTITLVVEVEGSCPTVMGEKKIERFRTEDGKWLRAATFLKRLEALGIRLVRFDIGESGPHTPIY